MSNTDEADTSNPIFNTGSVRGETVLSVQAMPMLSSHRHITSVVYECSRCNVRDGAISDSVEGARRIITGAGHWRQLPYNGGFLCPKCGSN